MLQLANKLSFFPCAGWGKAEKVKWWILPLPGETKGIKQQTPSTRHLFQVTAYSCSPICGTFRGKVCVCVCWGGVHDGAQVPKEQTASQQVVFSSRYVMFLYPEQWGIERKKSQFLPAPPELWHPRERKINGKNNHFPSPLTLCIVQGN